VYAELGETASGKKSRREDDEERIMSMNLGLAIEDMTVAMLVYEEAKNGLEQCFFCSLEKTSFYMEIEKL
jgi:ornithine cyclodeaminase/alanine dehydrogenase-like protein (mu-crystallin family)